MRGALYQSPPNGEWILVILLGIMTREEAIPLYVLSENVMAIARNFFLTV